MEKGVKNKIEVRPLEIQRWHGKTGKEDFKRPQTIQALVDSATSQYATGLTSEEREYYEEVLNVDLSASFNPDEPHPFWDSKMAQIRLDNATMIFDESIPIDFIKVRVMKESRFVANSMKEYNEGLWPDATHVIFDEAEQVEIEASKIEMKKKCVIDCSKLSKNRKAQMIMILTDKNLKGRSDSHIEVAIDKLIEKSTKEVFHYLSRDKEEVAIEALVKEALQKSVLHKKGHKIFYLDSVIGNNIADVVEYFSQPVNQNLKLRVTEQVA